MSTAYGPPERRGAGRAIASGPRTDRVRALHPPRRQPRRPLRLGSPGRPAAWCARPLARHRCNVEEQMPALRWQRALLPMRCRAQGLPRAASCAAAGAPRQRLIAGAAARRAGGASRRARRSGHAAAHLRAFRALQHLAGVVQREPRQRPAIDGDQRVARRDARALRGAARRGRDHLRGRAGEGNGGLLRVTGTSLFTPMDPPGRGVACAARYSQLTVEAASVQGRPAGPPAVAGPPVVRRRRSRQGPRTVGETAGGLKPLVCAQAGRQRGRGQPRPAALPLPCVSSAALAPRPGAGLSGRPEHLELADRLGARRPAHAGA